VIYKLLRKTKKLIFIYCSGMPLFANLLTVLSQSVRRWGTASLDVLLPPLCPSCDAPIAAAGGFCGECWQGLNFITAPLCPICGTPYELERGDLPCPACLKRQPIYAAARAALIYDDVSRTPLLRFKHADQTHLAKLLARIMVQAGAGILTPEIVVTPVPLHWWRLARRQYNQAALLASAIAQAQNLPCVQDLLLRTRATPPQGQRNAKARHANVRNAFALKRRYREWIIGRKIVLVDDVMTTGATVRECARILLIAGAAEVRVLTCARTVPVRDGVFE
jgi:ComF family protein